MIFITMSSVDEEKRLDYLESQIPAVSGLAFATARLQALDAGLKVLQTDDGVLYEVSPDGSKKAVGKVPASVSARVGKVIRLS